MAINLEHCVMLTFALTKCYYNEVDLEFSLNVLFESFYYILDWNLLESLYCKFALWSIAYEETGDHISLECYNVFEFGMKYKPIVFVLTHW